MADGPTSEALARIEHKLDILLWYLLTSERLAPPLPIMQADNLTCPVCIHPIKYEVDFMNKAVVRRCDCKTGLQAPIDLKAFAPVAPAEGQRSDGSEQEGGDDPNSGRRGSWFRGRKPNR